MSIEDSVTRKDFSQVIHIKIVKWLKREYEALKLLGEDISSYLNRELHPKQEREQKDPTVEARKFIQNQKLFDDCYVTPETRPDNASYEDFYQEMKDTLTQKNERDSLSKEWLFTRIQMKIDQRIERVL